MLLKRRLRVPQWILFVALTIFAFGGAEALRSAFGEFYSSIGEAIFYIAVIGIALLVMRLSKVRIDYIAPYRVNPGILNIILVIVIAVAFVPVLGTVIELTSLFYSNNINETFAAMTESKPFLLSLFEMAVIPAVAEEFLARGLGFGSMRQTGNRAMAIILSALLFGLMHMNLMQFFYTTVMGLCLALEVEITGSIWIPMIHHFVSNGISTLESYPDSPIAQAASYLDISFATNPLMSAVLLVAGIAITVVCLKFMRPTKSAKRLKDERDAQVAQELTELDKKPTGVCVPMILTFVMLTAFTLIISFSNGV